MKDTLNIKWVPRKINLEVTDINDVSPLYEAEALEDFQGEYFHKKGFKLNINHMIETQKYGQIMFIAPNPIEFYSTPNTPSRKSGDGVSSCINYVSGCP